jgi:hypothetical protein
VGVGQARHGIEPAAAYDSDFGLLHWFQYIGWGYVGMREGVGCTADLSTPLCSGRDDKGEG